MVFVSSKWLVEVTPKIKIKHTLKYTTIITGSAFDEIYLMIVTPGYSLAIKTYFYRVEP